MEESVSSEQRDRLSELPHSLILHILSFLEMRDVVLTNLLSKSWKNLWTNIPCLNFCYTLADENADDLVMVKRIGNFVNGALKCWKGTKILKFKISMSCYLEKLLAGDIDLWVRFAVENKVEELDIHSVGSKDDSRTVPQCLNSCSSIRRLSIVGYDLQIHGSPPWNQLKRLTIDGLWYSESLINGVLLVASQLEVFELCHQESYENLNIRSASLKKLKIHKYIFYSEDQPSKDTVLALCCPNLETLEILGILYPRCLFTNVSSLTAATLGFYESRYYDSESSGMWWSGLLGKTLRQFFSSFQHVERLTLSDWCVKVLSSSQEKHLSSPLPNVKFLKLDAVIVELSRLMHLFGTFPNLEMLVIDDQVFRQPQMCNAENYLEFETNLSKSFLLQLKTVEITSSAFTNPSIFMVIEFLLKHASILEKLVIPAKCFMKYRQEPFFEVAETLLSMPRSSPTARVIFDKN